jgi:hypothetical protein
MGLLTGVISSQAVKQSNINDPLDHFIGGDEAADAAPLIFARLSAENAITGGIRRPRGYAEQSCWNGL